MNTISSSPVVPSLLEDQRTKRSNVIYAIQHTEQMWTLVKQSHKRVSQDTKTNSNVFRAIFLHLKHKRYQCTHSGQMKQLF